MRRPLPLALAWALVALPSTTLAQGSTGELRDAPFRHRIAGELGLYTESPFHRLLPAVHASIGLLDPSAEHDLAVQLDVDWNGLAAIHDDPTDPAPGRESFRMFNPYVGARVAYEQRDDEWIWRGRGGLGVTLPLTSAYDHDADSNRELGEMQYWALGLAGMWDRWSSSIANMAFVVRGDLEVRHRYVLAGTEMALGVLVPLEARSAPGVHRLLVAPQLGAWAAGRPIEQLAIGLRFQAVAFYEADAVVRSDAILAIAPFVRVELDPGFIETRWLVNVHGPYAYPPLDFSPVRYDPIWSWSLGGGAQF